MKTQLLLAVLLSGVALAQGEVAPPANPAPTAAAAVEGISDAEKIRVSGEAVQRMKQLLKDVLGKLEEARATKDVVKLNCVNEKLTQIKGLLRISEQAETNLQEAVAKHEASAAEHEYTKVTIARQKVEQLRAEAEECIGQLAFRTDENLVVEIDEPDDLPSGDPSRPAPLPEVVTRPPQASPTL